MDDLLLEKVKGYKLGSYNPRFSYRDTAIKLPNYLASRAAASVPASCQYGVGVNYGMYLNDTYGDCTSATTGHEIQQWRARTNKPTPITDADILDFYDLTGQREGLDRTQGRYPEDVMSAWRDVGMRLGDGSFDKILGYAAIPFVNMQQVKAALYIFGTVAFSLALPVQAGYQLKAAEGAGTRPYWRLSTSDPGDKTPGSWGYHMMNLSAYSTSYYVGVTWAMRVNISPGWWKQYVTGAWAVLSEDWINTTGLAPNGMELLELQRDLAAL